MLVLDVWVWLSRLAREITAENKRVPLRTYLLATLRNHCNEFLTQDQILRFVLVPGCMYVCGQKCLRVVHVAVQFALLARANSNRKILSLAAKNVQISFLFIFSSFLIKFVLIPIFVA